VSANSRLLKLGQQQSRGGKHAIELLTPADRHDNYLIGG
jgi:hypothetical protein